MSGRHREPAALRIMRTGHGSLNRAAMEYLGWPTRIVIHERYYGLEIRAAQDSDHRPYCIPGADDPTAQGYTANFNARQCFTDARMMDADASAKYTALFGLDSDGETPVPVLMVCRANRLTVNDTRPMRQSRTVPA